MTDHDRRPRAVGAVAGSVLAPYAARLVGKKAAALTAFALSIPTAVSPFILRILGFFPLNHSAWLLPALLLFIVLVTLIGTSASILIASMIADVVEDSQVKTGRRSEGLFFAASAFTGKLVEVNLVLGIVRLALIVLAIVFSAIPLPFEADMTGTALTLWWVAVTILYLVASDFFQVARLAAFVQFWRAQ